MLRPRLRTGRLRSAAVARAKAVAALKGHHRLRLDLHWSATMLLASDCVGQVAGVDSLRHASLSPDGSYGDADGAERLVAVPLSLPEGQRRATLGTSRASHLAGRPGVVAEAKRRP